MRKRVRGCLITGVLIGVLLAVVALDVLLTSGKPSFFCPDDAEWIVVASDLPTVSECVLQTAAFEALNEQAPEYRASWEAAVRRDTGIRPTPLRWRVWLGRSFLGASSDEGRGACVQPGVLLRVADAVRGFGRWRPAVRQFGPYYYGWREGALLFSRSEQYVLASLEAEPFTPPHSPMTEEVWAFEGRSARSALRIWPGRQISCTGWIEPCSKEPRPLPPELSLLPLDSAIGWVAAPDMSSLGEFAAAFGDLADRHVAIAEKPWFKAAVELLKRAAGKGALEGLEADWDERVKGCLLALLDVDTSETLPVPEMGAVFQAESEAAGPHPLDGLTRDGPSMPYEWDGQPGVMAPRAGEKATLCLSRAGRFWLAASQEPAMAGLVRAAQNLREPVKEEIGGFAVVSVNWANAAAKAEVLAGQAANLELLPQMNAADLQKNVLPLLRALGSVGGARLHFTPSKDGQRLEFYGALTNESAS